MANDTTVSEVDKLKAEGNELFKAKNYLKAAATFTKAIKLDPGNAVLYSNRSAALRSLGKAKKSLEDAEKCIQLKPDWIKGYFRKSSVLLDMNRPHEALEAIRCAEKLDPKNREVSIKIMEATKKCKASEAEAATQALRKRHQFTDTEADRYLYKIVTSIAEKGEAAEDILVYFADCSAIGMQSAFDSPDTLAKCVEHVRADAKRRGGKLACAVVRKRAIAYPQVWVGKKWPFGNEDGYMVQLHSAKKSDRCVMFLPREQNEKDVIAYDLHLDSFRFMSDVIPEDL
mmetsp:Transcript_5505/g.16418  ORF Transcript_5505/g.16418 Transcript_5505/m.16418 type:complete len:286 (+) Transcript_5505:63-920(+)